MNLIVTNKKQENLTKHLKMFVYGASFSGKTTFASTFPKPLLISTDGNFKHIDIDAAIITDEMDWQTTSGVKIKKSGWDIFKDLVELLSKSDYETIIVDVIKDIYDMCRNTVLKSQGVIHESEIKAQGKSWALIDTEFLPVLRKLMTLNKNVILITHEKDRDGIMEPTTINSVTQKIQTYVDINARMIVKQVPGQDSYRTLVVRATAGQAGGNRLGLVNQIVDPTYDKLIADLNAMLETKKETKEK